MARFVLDPRAVDDLDQIWGYIADHSSAGAADRVQVQIFEAFRRLAATPFMGHSRPDYTSAPLLFWPVYDFLIAYLPQPAPLRILAVVHGSRDPRKISQILESR